MNKVYFFTLSHSLCIVLGVIMLFSWQSYFDDRISREIKGNDPHSEIISENNQELITEQKTTIKKRGDRLYLNTIFHTPEMGLVSVKNDIDTTPLFPKHIVSVGAIGMFNTQSVLLKVAYTYEHFGVSLYGGYSFKIQDWDAGIGLSYKFRF